MANGNPFYVQPGGNFLPGMQMLQQGVQRFGAQRKEEQLREKYENIKQGAIEAYQSGDPNRMAEFALKNPEISQALTGMMNFKNSRTKQNYINSGYDFLSNPSQANAENYTQNRLDFLKNQGLPPEQMQETAAFPQRFADNPERASNELAMTLSGLDPERWKNWQSAMTGGMSSELKVGAQEILEDGTIVQSTPKGPRVWDVTGKQLKGQEAKDAVIEARNLKIENLRKAAGEKRLATLEAEQDLKGDVEAGVISKKEAAKISVKAFERLEKIYQNIANIDEAIRLVDEGAQTGYIMSKLPSIRAASIKLDNLQGQLGLDVIGNTTFGALSENELKFAMSTALPQNLEGLDLKDWLIRKKDAQNKLADYLESAAIYLGKPGNTVSSFYEMKREKETINELPEGAKLINTLGGKNVYQLPNGELVVED